MKRPRWFLRLILVLLVVNITFFVMWYAFDVQGYVKGIVEREVSQALDGRFNIGQFSFNDNRLIARDIRFEAHNGTIDANIGHVRIKYKLLRFLTSWFSIGQAVSYIEIEHADITYIYRHDPSKPKGKKVEIPDLGRYFQELRLSHGDLKLDIRYPISATSTDSITFSERISDISILMDNRDTSRITVSAVTVNQGSLEVNGIIDHGAILSADIELSNYKPYKVEYPYGDPLQTEVSLNLSINQKDKDSPIDLAYESIIWNTRTSYQEYRIAVPYISVKGDAKTLNADILGAMANSSSVNVSLRLDDLDTKPKLLSNIDLKAVNLADFDIGVNGIVSGSVMVEGSIDNPSGKVNLISDKITSEYATFSDIHLEAVYADGMADVTINRALWEGHNILLKSVVDVKNQSATGTLSSAAPQDLSLIRRLVAEIDFDLTMIGSYPSASIDLVYFSYRDDTFLFEDYTGSIRVVPDIQNDKLEHLLVDASLQGGQGIELSITGDIVNRVLFSRVSFDSSYPHLIVKQQGLIRFKPQLSGSLVAILNGSTVTGQVETFINSKEFSNLTAHFESLFQIDINDRTGSVHLSSIDSKINGAPLAFNLGAEIDYPRLKLLNLSLNDKIRISGNLEVNDLFSSSAMLKVVNLNHSDLMKYLPKTMARIPDFLGLNLDLEYNLQGTRNLNLDARLRSLLIKGIQPLSVEATAQGDVDNISINGEVRAARTPLASVSDSGTIYPKVSLDLHGQTRNASLSRLLGDKGVDAQLEGNVSFRYEDILSSNHSMTVSADLIASELIVGGLIIDQVRTSVTQYNDYLQVDTLSAFSKDIFDLQASGSLDYNLLYNTFFEGDRSIDIILHGELFSWLKTNLEIIEDASGKSTLVCKLSTNDGQFNISSGNLDLSSPLIRIAGQGEPVTDLAINARFDNNRIIFDIAEFRMGQGKLQIRNVFDSDPGDHFFVGFLDLGRFLLSTDHNGIMVNVPVFTPANTFTRAILRGRNDNFASVRGPFDDMKISAEVMVSNSNVVYPSGTENLLNLARTVREAAIRRPTRDALPLPFVLDLMLVVQNNVRYVTYPANLEVFPGSFIHVVYDGNSWGVVEADFSSERGSLDFFGTVFQVEDVNVSIIAAQNLMQINGSFYKRTPDGTTVTLTVSTDKDTDKDLLSRLEFNLRSDNPQDITISHILSRLRYNRSIDEIDAAQRQTLLQDEALNLIYGNINASLLSPFLYPIENRVRRWLGLDSFSISAGFIQNLLTQYTVSSDMFSDVPNLDQYNNDVLLFSSAILLNNLSISAGKHLWRRIYADYQITFQEETDVAQKQQIVVSHDTSLRIVLPLQLRLAYTFQYKPYDDAFSHEIMLQRTFRF